MYILFIMIEAARLSRLFLFKHLKKHKFRYCADTRKADYAEVRCHTRFVILSATKELHALSAVQELSSAGFLLQQDIPIEFQAIFISHQSHKTCGLANISCT